MAKIPQAPTNMSFLFTGRKFLEVTRSPAPAAIALGGTFPAVAISDTTAPTQPGTPVGTAISTTQINWTWTASTDTGGSGLAGYRIYVDGSVTPATTTTLTSYSLTGLSAGTTHTLRVEAFDGAGNSTFSGTGSQTTQSAASGTLIFADDFETYSIGTSLGGTAPPTRVSPARWSNVDGSLGTNSVTVQTTPAASKGLRIRYVAGGHWSEQRYILDDTGIKQYTELWAEYDIYVSPNWDGGTDTSTNDKFFFFYNDDTSGKYFADFETYCYPPQNPTNNPNGFRGTFIKHQLKRDGGFAADGGGPNGWKEFIRADNGNNAGELYPFINYDTDRGSIIHVGFHVRMDLVPSYAAGTPVSQRGIVEVFRNGQQVWRRISETGTASAISGDPPRYTSYNEGVNSIGVSNNHMSGGYIMGYSNRGFTQQTDFYIDNFKIYNSYPGWGN